MDKRFEEFIEQYLESKSENISDIEKSRLYYLIGKEFVDALSHGDVEENLAQIRDRLEFLHGSPSASTPNIVKKEPKIKPDGKNKKGAHAVLRQDKIHKWTQLNSTPLVFWPQSLDQTFLEILEGQSNQSEIWERLTLSGKTFIQDILPAYPEQEPLKILKIGFSLWKLCGFGEVQYKRTQDHVIMDIVSNRFQSSLSLLFTLGAMQEIFRIAYDKAEFEDLASVPLFQVNEQGMHIEFDFEEGAND